MGIEQLSDEQLDTFESNYRKAKKTEGGKYSLSEILLEKLPRKPAVFGTRQVAAKIIEWRKNLRMDCAPMVKSGLSFDRTLLGRDTRCSQS